jgi:predicted dienelactone hydrolase
MLEVATAPASSEPPTAAPTPEVASDPTATTAAAAPPAEVNSSGVGVRLLSTDAAPRPPLAITVWYPTAAAPAAPVADAAPARGPWPIVVFSHGLRGESADYESLIAEWVSAGYVVVAPAYPYSNRNAATIDPSDVVNQPADASAAIDAVLATAATPGDPFAGALDPTRIIAAGHSEGGITTVGLFDECCRDDRLIGGIVLAGNSLGFPGSPSGSPVPMLFVHGDKDRLVPIKLGQAAYGELAGPQAFITITGGNHLDPYLEAGSPSFTDVVAATTGFLDYLSGGTDVAALRAALAAPGQTVDDQLT